MFLRPFKGYCGRCHPVRLIKATLLLAGGFILLTTLWHHLTGEAISSSLDNDYRNASTHFKQTATKAHAVVNEIQLKSSVFSSFLNTVKDKDGSIYNAMQKGESRMFQSSRTTPGSDGRHLRLIVNMSDPKAQSQLDYISHHLDVRYDVLGNEDGRFYVELTLTNRGIKKIEPCCWSIYFYHMKFIDIPAINSGYRALMRSEMQMNAVNVRSKEINFSILHVNGYTFKLQPTNQFLGIAPGMDVKLRLFGGGWSVSRGEVLPNWYVANDYFKTEPRLLLATVGEDLGFVGNFDTKSKSVRSMDDLFEPFTPEVRYKKNLVRDLKTAPKIILPTPYSIQLSEDNSELLVDGNTWTIIYEKGLENEAKYLYGFLSVPMKESSDAEALKDGGSKEIVLYVENEMKIDNREEFHIDDGYKLSIQSDKQRIVIAGVSPSGVFYGAVSLLSLAKYDTPTKHLFSPIEIFDAPRYGHRGVMVDVARNFHTKEELFVLMDAIAMYKMNILHLHLGDDEGWRLEIPGLPELTSVGGKRGHAVKENHHLMSMLGSGPFSNSSGSGYYTVEDYREVLRYAKSHHIEIIPEFDMPGHSHAAIKSMEARAARLKDTDEKEALKYLLSDLRDRSFYMSGQFFKDSAINPCIESSYRFVDFIVREVINMHKEISPLKRFHFGGDEVPQNAYAASPACHEFVKRHEKLATSKDLKAYFVQRVTKILAKYNVSVIGWEDAYTMADGQQMPLPEMKTKDVMSQYYYNGWESGMAKRAYEYANFGYKVILSPITAFYFDNPQEPDPEDWGLHWASRYVNTKRAFLFAPESIYDSIDYSFMGNPLSKQSLCGRRLIECPPLLKPKNILGLEAVMWSELIRTPDRLYSMLWPRLLALAERSWHKAKWESMEVEEERKQGRRNDWVDFANTVGHKELKRLEQLGVTYYLHRPGIRSRKNKLYVNTAFPGLKVQVSSDSGQNWSDFDKSVKYKGSLLFATRSFDGRRRSVPVSVIVK